MRRAEAGDHKEGAEDEIGHPSPIGEDHEHRTIRIDSRTAAATPTMAARIP
jgi:hypothetical protein